MPCPCMPPHCGTAVPTTSPGEQQFLHFTKGNSGSFKFTRETVVPISIHQGNSGSYKFTKRTMVPTTTPEEQQFLYSLWEQRFLHIRQGSNISYKPPME